MFFQIFPTPNCFLFHRSQLERHAPVGQQRNVGGSLGRWDHFHSLKVVISDIQVRFHFKQVVAEQLNLWKVWSNGTTSLPKSVPRVVLDKVRLVCSDLRCSTPMYMSEIKVPNKSLSRDFWTLGSLEKSTELYKSIQQKITPILNLLALP